MCVSNLQNEPEQWVVLHLPVPNLDVLALLDGEPAQERVQYRIHTLTDAFQQQAVPVAHCSLNGVQVAVWRGEGRGGKKVGLMPYNGLACLFIMYVAHRELCAHDYDLVYMKG